MSRFAIKRPLALRKDNVNVQIKVSESVNPLSLTSLRLSPNANLKSTGCQSPSNVSNTSGSPFNDAYMLDRAPPASNVDVKVGYKGMLIKTQKKPRKLKPPDDYLREFTKAFFNGDKELADNWILTFKMRNDPKGLDYEKSNCMLETLYHQGARRTILMKVLHISGPRYANLVEPKYGPRRNGFNPKAVGSSGVSALGIVRQSLPILDEGYSCNHRQVMYYINDNEVTSIKKLWEKYYINNPLITTTKMAMETFRKYWNEYHSDIRFKKLKEDECDTCIELQQGNQNILFRIHYNYHYSSSYYYLFLLLL